MSKILLLEDDLSLINGLSFAFKKQGFELNIARTLKEADALWADGRYDLLVLDVSLPDGTGFEFCKRVRHPSGGPAPYFQAVLPQPLFPGQAGHRAGPAAGKDHRGSP